MKLVASLLLGTTAAFAVVAGAQAADLPSKKAAPTSYVKICDAYGAGFFYIPGTDTCLKIGGRVRAEYLYVPASNLVGVAANAAPTAAKDGLAAAPTGGIKTPYQYQFAPSFQVASGAQDTSGFLARGVLMLDARTQSSWGTVRTFISARNELKTGIYADNVLTGTVSGQGGAATISIETALIQFAGFSFGRGSENFSFMPSWNYISHSWSSYPSGINQLTYTATFGGGFSATLSLEDRTGLGQASSPNGLFALNGTTKFGNTFGAVNPNNTTAGGTPSIWGSSVAVANGPVTLPALVGNIRLDQAWGAVQVMGAVVQNSAIVTGTNVYYDPTSVLNSGTTANSPVGPSGGVLQTLTTTGGIAGGAITKTGYAIGAGLKLNVPQFAAGDVLHLTAAYADGALDWITSQSASGRISNAGREFGGLIRNDRNLYVFPGAVTGTNGTGNATLNQVVSSVTSAQPKAWSIGGIFTHYWTPTIRQNIIASYLNITPPTQVQNTDWQLGGLSKANMWEVGTSFVWSPVRDFDIGLEVTYAKLNQSVAHFPGEAATTAGQVANPSTAGGVLAVPVLNAKVSPSMIQTRLRVERTF